jgi:hypothetical protein
MSRDVFVYAPQCKSRLRPSLSVQFSSCRSCVIFRRTGSRRRARNQILIVFGFAIR